MSPAVSDRISILDNLTLLSGSHDGDVQTEMCLMEAVAYVAGEPWSDHPACACPVISAFLRSWNDSLPTDADRDRLLKPLVLQLIDTKSTAAVEGHRSYLALDWMVRVFTPKWLDLVPSLAPHSAALQNLEDIADMAGAAVFVGGDDDFKIAPVTMRAARTAKMLGKWVHVGRVNTAKRVRNWVGLADSIDGSGMSRYDHMLEDVLAAIAGEHPQHSITEFDRAEGAAGW